MSEQNSPNIYLRLMTGLIVLTCLCVAVVSVNEIHEEPDGSRVITNIHGQRVNLPPRQIYRISQGERVWWSLDNVDYSGHHTSIRFRTTDGVEMNVSIPYVVEKLTEDRAKELYDYRLIEDVK